MPRALAPIRRRGLQVVHVVPFFTSSPEPGAQCGNPARWDLCGGRAERLVPSVPDMGCISYVATYVTEVMEPTVAEPQGVTVRPS